MSLRDLLTQHGAWLIISVILGAFVGAAELMARYRDEPAIVIRSQPGTLYIALNGLIAAAAYGLLVYYKDKLFVGLGDDPLMLSMVAGFGSMLVMRSKLLSIRTDGGESLAVGPELVLSTFLKSMDRVIDRNRSASRQKLVFESVKTLSEPVKAIAFLKISLASYQNLTDVEKKELNDIITDVQSQSDLAPQLKLMAICYGMLNLTGEKNYSTLMTYLKEYSEPDKEPGTQ